MRKIHGEMVATKKDYFEAILAAAQNGVDFGGLDVATFAQKEIDALDRNKGKSREVSEKVAAERAKVDEKVYTALTSFNSAKRVKAIAEIAEMSAQAVTASLKRLSDAGKVKSSEFEGLSLYEIA